MLKIDLVYDDNLDNKSKKNMSEWTTVKRAVKNGKFKFKDYDYIKKGEHRIFEKSKKDFNFNSHLGTFKARLDKKVDKRNAFLTKSQVVADSLNIKPNCWYNIEKNTELRDTVASNIVDAMNSLHTTEFKVTYSLYNDCPLIQIDWDDYHLHLFVPQRKPFALGGHCWRDNCSGISVETDIQLVLQVLNLPTKYDELVQYILVRC